MTLAAGLAEKRLREGMEKIVEYSKQTQNCSVCGGGSDYPVHLPDCPVRIAQKALALKKEDAEKDAEKYIEVAKAAEAIRDYLVGLAHPEAPVPPGNLERLDRALDDLEGVPEKDRIKPQDAEAAREAGLE